MIRHIVSWTLQAPDAEGKAAAIEGMRERLEPLVGVIPGLTSLVVRGDIGQVDANWDVVLVSEHESAEALAAYQAHPDHIAAGPFVRSVVADKSCVDYEF
ncbi:MAG: Dabb family protein [Actinomycetes bacterium]